MDGFNKQLKKGVLEIVLLKLISQKEMYGYDIIKHLENKSNGYYILKEGSLYPILYRLEDKKLIESFRKDEISTSRKVPRKYYKITPEGWKALEILIRTWDSFVDINNQIIKEEC